MLRQGYYCSTTVWDETTWGDRRGWRWQQLSQPKERARCTSQTYIGVYKGAFRQEKKKEKKIEKNGLPCPEFRGL